MPPPLASVPHHVPLLGRKRKAEPLTRTIAYLRHLNQRGNVICSVLTLETNPGISELKQFLSTRLVQIPRFRSRVVATKNVRAHFEEVPFDLGYHFEVHGFGRKVSENELKNVISATLERPFLDSKPLWRVIHIPEMEHDGTSRVLFFIDHTIGDGVGLVNVLLFKLADEDITSKSGGGEVKKRESVAMAHKPSLRKRMGIAAYGVYQGQTQVFWSQDKPNPIKLVGRGSDKKLVAKCQGRIDLSKVKELAKKSGLNCTVNDVLMSVFSRTISEYLLKTEDKTKVSQRKIRAQFPINMRPKNTPRFNAEGDPVNDFVFGLFRLPLKKADDTKWLIGKVKEQMDEAKMSPAYHIARKTPGRLLPIMPRNTFTNLAADSSNISTCQLSNVPGPQHEITFMGTRVLDFEFYLHSAIGLYFGIFSYNGFVTCTVNADVTTGIDPQAMADLFIPSFEAMYHDVCMGEGVGV